MYEYIFWSGVSGARANEFGSLIDLSQLAFMGVVSFYTYT